MAGVGVFVVAGVSVSFLLLVLVVLPLVHFALPPPGFVDSFVLTAVLGGLAAALSLFPGLAAAMAARRGGLWELFMTSMYVPAVVPPTSVGVLLLAAFNLPGLYCRGGVAELCGLAEFVQRYVVNNVAGIFVAMFVMALPVSFSVYDGALREERAEAFFRSLGFSGLRLLWVTALSLRSATLSAFIFSWVRSFGELGVLLVFASYPPAMAVYIYNVWLQYGVAQAVGASIAMIALGVAAAFVLKRWSWR